MSRRQTLGPMTSSQDNRKRSTSRGRMSLGPAHSTKSAARLRKERRSTIATQGRPINSKRASMGRPSLGKSGGASRNSLGGQRSAQPNRRKSISRRSSVYGKHTAVRVQDPRPIGDKHYQKKNIAALITYLTSHYYDRPIGPKTLMSPTGKDFEYIVTFLFRQVDPNFEFTAGCFAEEFTKFMQRFGYPFNISRSSLTAVGSPHTWPSLLAAILWLIEFLQYDEEVEAQGDKTLMEGEVGEKVFFEYCGNAYKNFLEGEDNYSVLDQDLADTFQAKNQHVEEEVERLKQENARLNTEIATLRNTQSTIPTLQTTRANLLSDVQKFESCISKLEAHKVAVEKKVEERTHDAKEKEEQLASTRAEKEVLTETLDKQEFSPFEVQKMGHERKMLEDSLASLSEQKEKVQREIWDMEMTLCKVLATVEKRATEYNETAAQLGVVPATAKYAEGEDYSLAVDQHAETAAAMVNVDLTHKVKPALLRLKARLSAEYSATQKQLRALNEKHAQAQDVLADQSEKVEQLQLRLKKIESTYRTERDVMNKELKASVSAVEDVELELHRLKSSEKLALGQSEKLIANTELELQQVHDIHAEEREALNEQICTVMDEVASHKVHVTEVLEQLELQTRTAKQQMLAATQ